MLKKADLESLSLISDLKNKLNEIDLKSITLIGICGAAAYYLYNIN